MSARFVLVLSFLSGALALSYEVLWARHLLNLFGSTATATASMLAAFMVGMAIGAWVMAQWSVRVSRPLVAYAAIEVGLALYGLAFATVTDIASTLLPIGRVIGPGGIDLTLSVRMFGNAGVLLLPTTLMGATLPILAAAMQSCGEARPRGLARVYGLNTLGGVIGAFAMGFWTLPTLGLTRSQFVTALFALFVAIAAVAIDRLHRRLPIAPNRQLEVDQPSEIQHLPKGILEGALLLSGFAALGYEVLWTRVLVLVMGSSTYAFTMMLGTYLLGLALGGLWIGRYLDRLRAPATAFQHIQLAVALSALIGVAAYSYLPSVALAGFADLGGSAWAVGATNTLIATALVLIPTFFLGAALPVAARLMQRRRPRRGRELGTAFAWVSGGHIGGILGTAFVIIPAVGLQRGVAVLAGFNAASAVLLWLGARRSWTEKGLAVPLAVATLVAVGWLLPPWDVNLMTSGVYRQAPLYLKLLGSWRGLKRAFAQYNTVFYREGTEAVVAVFERPTLSTKPHIVLTLNGKVDASTGADMKTQVLSGHLPMIYGGKARRALVVGLASGVTVGALARHALEKIDVVEIEKEVVGASRAFDAFSGAPLDDARVKVIVEDGRQYLRGTKNAYDVIVSEPSNPWLSSSARLFTREFFALVRKRLTANGVFVQWVPLYGISKLQFRALLRTIMEVFPNVEVFRAAESDLLVVGSVSQLKLKPKALKALFADPKVREDLKRVGIASSEGLAALWVADQDGLASAVGDGPLNTDDNGLVEFGSPWYVLRDTLAENLAILAHATSGSAIAGELAANWTEAAGGRENGLDKIARLHFAAGRSDLARALAGRIRAKDQVAGDILLGDFAAAEGKWKKAIALWQRHDVPQTWARLAEVELRRGNLSKAASLFAKSVASAPIPAPKVLLGYGLALSALGDKRKALSVLAGLGSDTDSLPGVIAPVLRANVLDRLGRTGDAAAERATFTAALNRLRKHLEVERGQNLLNSLIKWVKASRSALPAKTLGELQSALYRQITGPLSTYYRAVSFIWLGEYGSAEKLLETYIKMLPDKGAGSKAQELLALSRRGIVTLR